MKGGITIVDLGIEVNQRAKDSNILFFRDFYHELLEDVRQSEMSLLIGNPGIGKSFFHYYYLARIINPSLFGSLPPDHNGSCDPPEIIVRQVCGSYIEVYDLILKNVYYLKDTPGNAIELLDPQGPLRPEKSLYLVEPGQKLIIGPENTIIPTLFTASPNPKSYQEFEKIDGVERLYMPCYSLEELLAVGKFMREHKKVAPVNTFYEEATIKKNFDRFGGILRHIFPGSSRKFQRAIEAQENAIKAAKYPEQVRKILDVETLEGDISQYIVQYQVPRETIINKKTKDILVTRFSNPTLKIASRYVLNELQDFLLEVLTNDDRIHTLFQNDTNNTE